MALGVRLLFHSPRIPQNTGTTIRLAAAVGCELHLAGPLGFELTDTKLKRAGLDYHDLAQVRVHEDLTAAYAELLPARVFAYTTHADTMFTSIAYRPGDVLLFGPEPTGLDPDVLADPRVTGQVRIPMLPGRRSLNLANAAAIAAYEAWRQTDFT
ncbi:MAG TPA: tRNA (cytidine(34)-2'-O)-methyltransferase [Propionibacterium sp.]|jgi:tRNA (cytidine/uridine-2'-O-)-methyltransferase|nr:tRNA (cytidine(34)-2'-O)-methyltransferase [Propionibacterium sp.]